MKKISAYAFMIIAIVALIAILLMLCPWFNITEKNVIGNENVSSEKILEEINLNNNSVNLFAFNRFSAIKKLKTNPYIENVKITKKLPNTLNINITERKIRGYVPYLKKYIYIDDEGMVLDVQSAYKQPRPIVMGLDFSTFTLGEKLPVGNEKAFNTIVELSKLMTKQELLETVIKIDVSDTKNIKLYVNNMIVYFGDMNDGNKKLATLKEIVKKIPKEDKGFLHLENSDEEPRFEFMT